LLVILYELYYDARNHEYQILITICKNPKLTKCHYIFSKICRSYA